MAKIIIGLAGQRRPNAGAGGPIEMVAAEPAGFPSGRAPAAAYVLLSSIYLDESHVNVGSEIKFWPHSRRERLPEDFRSEATVFK